MNRARSSRDPESFQSKVYLLILDKLVIGAMIGLAVLVYDAYRTREQRQHDNAQTAVADFLVAAWGGEADGLDYVRALSRLSAYAPPVALEAINAYQRTQCAAQGDRTRECRAAWAHVVNVLRSTNAAAPLSEDSIIELIWGKE